MGKIDKKFIIGTMIGLIGLFLAFFQFCTSEKDPKVHIGYNFTSISEIGIYIQNYRNTSVTVEKLTFLIDSIEIEAVNQEAYDEIIYSLTQIVPNNIKANIITTDSIIAPNESKFLFFLNENIEYNKELLKCLIGNLEISLEVRNTDGKKKALEVFDPFSDSSLQAILSGCVIRMKR